MPYMYILECSDGSYYTGSTWNLERRLWEHQNGLGAKHTAKRLPVTLLYCEECERIEDAYIREKQVQGWSRKKKQALIAGDMNQIHRLAECRNGSHWSNFGFGYAQPTGSTLSTGSTELTDSTQPTDSVQSMGFPHSMDCTQLMASAGSEDSAQAIIPYRSLSGVEGNNATHTFLQEPFDSAQGTEDIKISDKPKRILE